VYFLQSKLQEFPKAYLLQLMSLLQQVDPATREPSDDDNPATTRQKPVIFIKVKTSITNIASAIYDIFY